MDFFKDFFPNAVNKGIPAVAGGVVCKGVNNKIITPMIKDYRTKNPLKTGETGVVEWVGPLLPGFAGLCMLNKKDNWLSYAGAGVLAVSSADTMEAKTEFLKGDGSNRLADALDEIFKRVRAI